MKLRAHWLVVSMVAATAVAEGEERSLEWLRGRTRHIPARVDDSVIVEGKSYGPEQGYCEIEVILRQLIGGDDAWWLLREVGEECAQPSDDEEYILARFYIRVLEKRGVKRFRADHTLFNALSKNGIVYPEEFPLEKLTPGVAADLREGVEYEGWVCFHVAKEDDPVAVFGRKWGRESEGYFALRSEGGKTVAERVAYKGQLRSPSWVKSKFRGHRRKYAHANGVFLEVDSVPIHEGRSTRRRQPNDPPPSIEEMKLHLVGKRSAEAAGMRPTVIQASDRRGRFEATGDWGWIKGEVFQILSAREMLVTAGDGTFHIGQCSTEGIIDGAPFEAWVKTVGTHRYATVRGGTRTVWDCRILEVEFNYPVDIDQFKRLLRAGVELYKWKKIVEKCPECNGAGKVLEDRVVYRIVGNVTNRRIVRETVPAWVRCETCGGRGEVARRWEKEKDY